jgi:phage terminase large subunit GpA-like protein
MNLSDGYRLVMEAAARGLMPDPELEIDKWAEEFMVLPRDAAEPGPYRLARTPPARRILQVLSPRHPAKRIVIRGASQMMKTQIAINFLCASAHRAPANMLVLEPTDSLAKRLSARISKTIRDVPVLQTVFAPPRSRDNRNTVFAKDFSGGTMYIATAGSAANLAEIPARYVVIDEVERLETSVDGEGDPVDLAEARATTFQSNCKYLEVSSPGVLGGKIDVLYDQGTREVYLVPCPHCKHEHEFAIEHLRYRRDDDTGHMTHAWFVCPECGAEIEERQKAAMIAAGRWHARSVGDGETLSFHVSAFYAQAGSITWLQLARQYARAKERLERGDPDAMQVFYNTRLALSWENTLERTTAQELQVRQQIDAIPPRVIPDPALVVTLTVDTQTNRLELQAEAWGPDLEHWVIDHKVLMGSPTESPESPDSVWARLDEYRKQPFLHESGALIQVSAYGIDSGGANTQDVYNYGAARAQVACVILHGSSKPNRPIISSTPSKVDIDWHGKRQEGGALLWSIGTDVAKDHLHNRWKLHHGAGAMHFDAALPLEWFEQLLAERPVLKRKPGGKLQRVWEKVSPGARNEALDLAAYNLALAHHLGLHKWSALDWRRLRQRLVPKAQMVAEAVTVAAVEPAPAPTAAIAPTPLQSGRRVLSRGIR